MIFPDVSEGHDWRSVSRASLIAWLLFYVLFLAHAWLDDDGFLLIDNVNLIVHEAGHFLFGWFGFIIGILGGSLMELLVPFLLGLHFWRQREPAAVTFCGFWFFQNFLYIGRYMADARSLSLPLVGSGDHDWEILFSHWNLLVHDRAIGGAMNFLGWLGMLASIGWLIWMWRRTGE